MAKEDKKKKRDILGDFLSMSNQDIMFDKQALKRPEVEVDAKKANEASIDLPFLKDIKEEESRAAFRREGMPKTDLTRPGSNVKKTASKVARKIKTKSFSKPGQKKETRSNIADQFTGALSKFAPQAIAGLVGAAFEGSEGAVAGIEAVQGMESQQAAANKAQRELDIKQQDANTRRLAVAAKITKDAKAGQPLSTQQRMLALGGEEKKRFDGAQMGMRSLEQAKAAIEKGVNRFSLAGDNEFTFARAQWKEAIGRMQSGGAITEDEEKAFIDLFPGKFDDENITKLKLNQMRTEMTSRLATLGFAPDELGFGLSPDKQSRLEALRAKKGK